MDEYPCTWRIAGEPGRGDAVGAALSRGRATLWYGPRCFACSRESDESGNYLLRLQPVGHLLLAGIEAQVLASDAAGLPHDSYVIRCACPPVGRPAMKLTGTLHPWASTGKAGRVRSHEGGRVCAQSGCATILSIYNPTRFCTLHAQSAACARHRAQEHALREVSCAHCGAEFETRNLARRFCSDRCRMAAFARRKRAAVRARMRLLSAQEATP